MQKYTPSSTIYQAPPSTTSAYSSVSASTYAAFASHNSTQYTNSTSTSAASYSSTAAVAKHTLAYEVPNANGEGNIELIYRDVIQLGNLVEDAR